MGNMVGQACPNVAVQLGLEWVCRCRCSVEYCQRLMGGVWWAHNGAPTMEGWLLGQCAWCGLGEGQMQSSTQTFQQCTKHPQGPVWRCACMSGQHGVWFLVVAGTSWGCEKSVVNLSGILPKPVLILLIHNE